MITNITQKHRLIKTVLIIKKVFFLTTHDNFARGSLGNRWLPIRHYYGNELADLGNHKFSNLQIAGF